MRAAVAAALLAAAFAAVAALNAVGSFDGIDAYAVHHLMPGLDPAHSSEPSLLDAIRPFAGGGGPGERVADVWLYPASAPVSALIVALACLVLWRRARRRAALVWGTTFVAAVAVEVLVKHVVRRPELHAEGYHILGFDDSLPSGHTLRSLLVAVVVTVAWRRYGAAAAAWALTILPLLVVVGWHTPSDIVAGLLLAATATAAALAILHPSRRSLRLQSGPMLLPTLDDPLSTDAEPASHQAAARPGTDGRRPARAPRGR